MKVLNVNSSLDPVTGGGTAERTLQLSRALLESDVDCSIMTTDFGFAGKSFTRLTELKNGRIVVYPCLFKRFYIPKIRFSEICKEVKSVDIVHLMGHWSILNALVYVAVRICNKPYVVCPAGALPIFGRSKILKKFYNWVIGRRIIRNANARIAITQDECKHFESYSIPSDSVVIIPNGVNPTDFLVKNINDFKTKHGIDSQPFILFLGRLNIIKGPDLLLEAFIKGRFLWPNWHLVFVGPDGGLLSSLKKRAEASGIEGKIHFAGYLGGSAKSSAYHAADLLVVPSRQEAMSIVVLEAGISGTPVILTDQCGFNEISNTGSAIVSSATVDGLYQALDEMIKNSDQLVAMGTALKKFVLNNYTWSVAVKKYLDLYKQLLHK